LPKVTGEICQQWYDETAVLAIFLLHLELNLLILVTTSGNLKPTSVNNNCVPKKRGLVYVKCGLPKNLKGQ
jgi:hypothetical protein